MNDDYTHDDKKVLYVEENIPGPSEQSEEYAELLNTFNSQLMDHCGCSLVCKPETCNCLHRSNGSNYTLPTENNETKLRLNYHSKDFKTDPIIECNSLCQCSEKCRNRLVQYGPIKGLVIKICGNKGMGLVTENDIYKGAFICEYAGEVITKSQALKRLEFNKSEGKMNYIYCLNEHCNGKIMQTFIDPSYFGNIGRYMNHSCEPNCQIIPVRVDSPIPKLAIFTSVDITVDSELTFDYGACNIGNSASETPENINNRKKCLCNSHKCKGLMPFDIY